MQIDSIGRPEVLMCLSPIWAEKHETARWLAQQIKTVLDVARSKGYHEGESPVLAISNSGALSKVKKKVTHPKAMRWRDVPAVFADLRERNALAVKALMFTCLSGPRTGEVLGMQWDELGFEARLWTCPAERIEGSEAHRVPLTDAMVAILGSLGALRSEVVKPTHDGFAGWSVCLDAATFDGPWQAVFDGKRNWKIEFATTTLSGQWGRPRLERAHAAFMEIGAENGDLSWPQIARKHKAETGEEPDVRTLRRWRDEYLQGESDI
ncbi:MAG: hypothetical protein AAFP28_02755 [Pseudomonadota bacterium]